MEIQIKYKWIAYEYKLTYREWEILNLLIYGYKKKDISKKLGISVSTIYTHEKSIKEKTCANTLYETIRKILFNYFNKGI